MTGTRVPPLPLSVGWIGLVWHWVQASKKNITDTRCCLQYCNSEAALCRLLLVKKIHKALIFFKEPKHYTIDWCQLIWTASNNDSTSLWTFVSNPFGPVRVPDSCTPEEVLLSVSLWADRLSIVRALEALVCQLALKWLRSH